MPVAQVNVARILAPLDDPVMVDFVNNLDQLNKLAEETNGFIWRFKEESNERVKTVHLHGYDHILVNLSVWDTVDDLYDYVYKTTHAEMLKRKGEWFTRMKQMHMAIWHMQPNRFPDVDEAAQRLEYIRDKGESPYAFTFKTRFSKEDLVGYEMSAS